MLAKRFKVILIKKKYIMINNHLTYSTGKNRKHKNSRTKHTIEPKPATGYGGNMHLLCPLYPTVKKKR